MSYEYAMSIINAPVATNFDEDQEVDTEGLTRGYDEDDIDDILMTSEEAAKKILAVLNQTKSIKKRGRPRKQS